MIATDPNYEVEGRAIFGFFFGIVVHFVMATAGLVGFTALVSGEPIRMMGEGLMFVVTGVPVLFFETVLYVIVAKGRIIDPGLPMRPQLVVICVASVVVGASLFFILVGISTVVYSTPLLASNDASWVAIFALTPLICAVMMRILVWIGARGAQWYSRGRAA
jgi:hypothetical protein